MKNGIQKGVRVDKTNPIFTDDDTHTSDDEVAEYICIGGESWGVGHTPKQAIDAAKKAGLDRKSDVWAVWESLISHGRIRLIAETKSITVVPPIDMDWDESLFWESKYKPARLRMIACSSKFSVRIIRVRTNRIERELRRKMQLQGIDIDPTQAIEAVEELLKGDANGD